MVGTSFSDAQDRNALNGGARVTFLNPDQQDAVITGELQFLSQTVLTGADYKTPRYKYLTDISLALYEFYNPFAFRLLGGPSMEWRDSKPNYGASYRAGLGYYSSSRLSLFADLGGRWISRKAMASMPYDFSLSFQLIF